MEMVRGQVKVELEHIGEGFDGDYDPEDADDAPLMRFSVYGKPDGAEWPGLEWGEPNAEGWQAFNDASYCTHIRDDISVPAKLDYLKRLMDEVYDDASAGKSIKKLCEHLSHIR